MPSLQHAMTRPVLMLICACGLIAMAGSASAQTVSREEDIAEIRLGQKIQVDDGSCPTGQIKEVSGTNLTAAGVTRVRKCVPRLGPKKR